MAENRNYENLMEEVDELKIVKNIMNKIYSKKLKMLKDWDEKDIRKNCNTLKEAIYHYMKFYNDGSWVSIRDIYNNIESNDYYSIGGATPYNSVSTKTNDIYKEGKLSRKKINGVYHYHSCETKK